MRWYDLQKEINTMILFFVFCTIALVATVILDTYQKTHSQDKQR